MNSMNDDQRSDNKCILCPRACAKTRYEGDFGYCNSSNNVKIARAGLHMWEEPCISGTEGSGAVFFSGCNLGCVFCQNHEISRGNAGREISTSRLSDIFIELQNKNANNINLVTASHYINQVVEAIALARGKGLTIPIVYNTGTYETKEAIRSLEGHVDVYLPDCKYYSDELSVKYSNAPSYFDYARAAIDEMIEQTGEISFDERGIVNKGVIIRHMVLPGSKKDSKKILESLYKRYGNKVFFSIMSQYTPMDGIDGDRFPELKRKVTKREYMDVVDFAIELGIENAFIQEGDVAKESFIPLFDMSGV